MTIDLQQDKSETNLTDCKSDQLISESLYRTVFETTGTATIIIEEDTIISNVNRKFESLSGYSKEQVEGKKSWTDFIEKSCLEKMIMYHKTRRVDPDSAPGSYECQFIDRNGDVRDVYVTVAIIPGTKKSVVSILDITESIKARQALQESETKFKLLFQKSVDPILLLDSNKFTDCNDAACKIMHCTSKEQLLGLSPTQVSPEIQPDGRLTSDKGREVFDTAEKEGSSFFEWVHINRDNEPFWAEVSLTAVPIKGKKYLYTVWRDITKRKQAEAALQESEERYKTAIENSNDGILIVKDGRYVSVNRRLVEMLGYESAGEIEGKDIGMTIHPDYVDKVMGISIEQNSKERLATAYEIKHIKKDGTFIDTEASITKTTLKGEAVLLVYLRDTTHRNLAKEALKKRENELEIKSINLEEANIALKVLLKHREEDKKALKDTILANVQELVFPYIERLKNGHLSDNQIVYLGILETNLRDIISPFLQKMTSNYSTFTPTEIQVAGLIKNGKTSKEIAELMNISTGTIDTHRNSIRSKLDLNNKKINLRTYLLSL
ncbi:MAG: PAS domain S-box protein [Proteobacteria bacterium]|nr:PAS domain S-box protein [Pseudomonadota bacterium]